MSKCLVALVLLLLLPIQTSAEAIRWQSYQEGLKKAKAENRKIFLNFHADW
jgi:thiol:disulfide interchange protein